MKHENNFLLYSIASAFLMVSGMMLLSSASHQRNLNLIANVVTVTATVPEKEAYNRYSVAGLIEGIDQNSKQVMRASLWQEGENGFMTQIDSKELSSTTGFFYSFEKLRAGLYAVKLETSDGVEVVQPKPFVQGISKSSHIIFISTSPEQTVYQANNFTVLESL